MSERRPKRNGDCTHSGPAFGSTEKQNGQWQLVRSDSQPCQHRTTAQIFGCIEKLNLLLPAIGGGAYPSHRACLCNGQSHANPEHKENTDFYHLGGFEREIRNAIAPLAPFDVGRLFNFLFRVWRRTWGSCPTLFSPLTVNELRIMRIRRPKSPRDANIRKPNSVRFSITTMFSSMEACLSILLGLLTIQADRHAIYQPRLHGHLDGHQSAQHQGH